MTSTPRVKKNHRVTGGRAGAGVPHRRGRIGHRRNRFGHSGQRAERGVPGGAGVRGGGLGQPADHPVQRCTGGGSPPRRGVGIYGGLISCIVLIVFSPAVSGTKTSMLPGEDPDFFPLSNPGIVSSRWPAGHHRTLTSRRHRRSELNAEMEVRSLTGVGAGEGDAPLGRFLVRQRLNLRSGGTVFGGWRRAGRHSSSNRVVAAATSTTAASNTSAMAAGGTGASPLTFRTYCRAAAMISSFVAAGPGPVGSVMFRHISQSKPLPAGVD